MLNNNSVFTPSEEAELVSTNWGLICSAARRFSIHTIEYDDALSIASEAYIKALRSYRPDKGTTLAGFCYTVMANALIDEQRRVKNRTVDKITGKSYISYSLDATPDDYGNSDSMRSNYESTFEIADDIKLEERGFADFELKEVLTAVLDKLPRDEYLALYHLYIEEKTQQEVAIIMNTSQPNVSKKIQSGLQRARRILIRSQK